MILDSLHWEWNSIFFKDEQKSNKNQIMLFNPLIIYSLEKSNKEYLRGCKTAYSMIDRLKKRFYQIWLCTLLNILEYKIINLKLINNDYIQYINELNNLFE